ncbi:MAG: GyrI-like domain-containing protein [Rhizobiaceae bacterium]
MEKIDLKKAHKDLYSAPRGDFIVLRVPPLRYLMIDGYGDPNVELSYKEAVEALYVASYTLKFMCKESEGRDYVVPPLEGLWWADDLTDFKTRRKDRWSWTMMIMVPELVGQALAVSAIKKAEAKKGLPALSKVRVATLDEGIVAQTLHVGPYDAEGPILHKLHDEFLPANGYAETGHHHEIYLGDPRKAAPEKLRTILRQPIKVL